MSDPTSETPRAKKRKLRYSRVSNACDFCKKRKVRCSGAQPCEVCFREEITCVYSSGVARVPELRLQEDEAPAAAASVHPDNSLSARPIPATTILPQSNGSSRPESALASTSRRSSIGHGADFIAGNHVGPTSGVSFLYHAWNRPGGIDARPDLLSDDENVPISQAPLVSYGDIPQLDSSVADHLPPLNFTKEQFLDLLERYFQYISPTYRFLHHPTVKKWATALVSQDAQTTVAQQACVLLACAQTLLHSSATQGEPLVGNGDMRLSMACSEQAKTLLDKEPGPPSLASVQARIGMCLYLLSTYRLNECRYCFSFAVTVATALGIHRHQSSKHVNSLDAECRKRTFWSAYVLDAYLSVMLGRPRLLRDDDIDQPFPCNIDDHDLTSSEPVDALPQHGNLEAFISHAKLAKLTARNNDQLYPLHPLTYEEMLFRSIRMLNELKEWEDTLPAFLKPREKTLTGQRTFERQNTILKLALAHVRILATRRCLLHDLDKTTLSVTPSADERASRAVRECVSAIITILDTISILIDSGQCYSPFWSTQYIALVAISTFYVLVIQGVRHSLPDDIASIIDVNESFQKARRCHEHLAKLPPPGSQAERHHLLLSHLRSKAVRSLSRLNTLAPSGVPRSAAARSTRDRRAANASVARRNHSSNAMSISNLNNTAHTPPQTMDGVDAGLGPVLSNFDESELAMMNANASNDLSMFPPVLTPNQASDSGFQFMLDAGWEGLDTVGAFMVGYTANDFE